MPVKTTHVEPNAADRLLSLGAEIRAHRKLLGISATSAAQAAGMSRVTWHRIEKGEPSVTMGAYLGAMEVLGLDFGLQATSEPSTGAASGKDRTGWLPARVRLADYPQLRKLAWQVQGTDALTPMEAFGIYERNRRHMDAEALGPEERQLIDALHLAFSEGKGDV
jgi:transcriptional regulator with XRE-family HTH domain